MTSLWPRLYFAGLMHDASDVRFLCDRTWLDSRGIRHNEREILDAMFDTMRAAAALLCAISDAPGGHYFNRTPVVPDMIINAVAGQRQSHRPLQVNTT